MQNVDNDKSITENGLARILANAVQRAACTGHARPPAWLRDFKHHSLLSGILWEAAASEPGLCFMWLEQQFASQHIAEVCVDDQILPVAAALHECFEAVGSVLREWGIRNPQELQSHLRGHRRRARVGWTLSVAASIEIWHQLEQFDHRVKVFDVAVRQLIQTKRQPDAPRTAARPKTGATEPQTETGLSLMTLI